MFEKLIRKWWFYVIGVIMLLMPSIVQQPVSSENTPAVIQEVMQNPLFHGMTALFPLAKVILLFLITSTLIWKVKFTRTFSILSTVLLSFIAILQNISLDTRFGYAILVGNIILLAVLVCAWVYESKVCRNDFSKPRFGWWNFILLMLAFFAFWMPAQNGQMDFSIAGLLMNEAGLTGCMVIPVLLSILLIYYPNLNDVTLRITSFIGLIFGIVNMITWFALNTAYWWMGIVHLPLLIISLTGLILSKRLTKMLNAGRHKQITAMG